ncbi:MAG: hypothetical protein ABR529_11555 [Actinomycetota bacterium]
MRTIIGDCPEPGLIIRSLLDELKAFEGEESEQEDDITLVVVHSTGQETHSRTVPTDPNGQGAIQPSLIAGPP